MNIRDYCTSVVVYMQRFRKYSSRVTPDIPVLDVMYLERVCAPPANAIETRILDRLHLLEIIDELNTKHIQNSTIVVSFDIVNTFQTIDNIRGIEAQLS